VPAELSAGGEYGCGSCGCKYQKGKSVCRGDDLPSAFAGRLRRGSSSSTPTSNRVSRSLPAVGNHTADWPRAAAALNTLRESLKRRDQPPLKQDAGGSWGPCCTEWYRKLEPTVGALLAIDGVRRRLRPLKFMARLQDPTWTVAYLKSLQVSDIRWTKRNNRDELGALAPVYAWFTEGFDAPDIKQAKAQLNELNQT
jgi:hypothetical protein